MGAFGAVVFLLFTLALTACDRGADSDVVRSGLQEGSSTPSLVGATAPGASSVSPSVGRVVVLGTSLTAGRGLVDQSTRFTNRVQTMVDSAGFPFTIVNAGVGGETSAGGLRRIGWLLQEPVSVLILELGANDGLRGLSPSAMKGNLQAVIDSTLARFPEARLILAGMQAPPNLGQDYVSEFRAVYTDLAQENDAVLVPFLLEGVAGDPELNQADGIHPTGEGHRRVAETVWRYLRPVLDEVMAAPERRP